MMNLFRTLAAAILLLGCATAPAPAQAQAAQAQWSGVERIVAIGDQKAHLAVDQHGGVGGELSRAQQRHAHRDDGAHASQGAGNSGSVHA